MPEEKRKICPYCGEEILATANMCKHCKEWLVEERQPTGLGFDKKILIIPSLIVVSITLIIGVILITGAFINKYYENQLLAGCNKAQAEEDVITYSCPIKNLWETVVVKRAKDENLYNYFVFGSSNGPDGPLLGKIVRKHEQYYCKYLWDKKSKPCTIPDFVTTLTEESRVRKYFGEDKTKEILSTLLFGCNITETNETDGYIEKIYTCSNKPWYIKSSQNEDSSWVTFSAYTLQKGKKPDYTDTDGFLGVLSWEWGQYSCDFGYGNFYEECSIEDFSKRLTVEVEKIKRTIAEEQRRIEEEKQWELEYQQEQQRQEAYYREQERQEKYRKQMEIQNERNYQSQQFF